MVESRSARDIGPAFVGRQREMAELRSALDDALSGHGGMVMLSGEPGIGKTRTAQQLASYAQEQSVQVLWGWCYEGEGAPPYWPWVQIIRSYVQQCDAGRLESEMGPGAANIADAVPELQTKITGLKPPSPLEPEAARFRLFDSITSFLKNAARSQPLMLVLDDIHWADTPSLLLFQFLARELAPSQSGRLLVVGCYRDAELSQKHPLSDTLAQLARTTGRGGGFQHHLLPGFDKNDAARFIQANTGIEPTEALVETLLSHTQGNPYFMNEVIRLLSDSGELTAGHIGTPEDMMIPEGVRAVIVQRLSRLPDQCHELLTTASIIGFEFDFRLFDILGGGMSEDQLLQAVDEAVSSHLIEEVPGQMDRYRFTHALIRQTLADEVTTARRVRLHARIGEALEVLYGSDAESHAAELASHFAEAQTSTGPVKLVRYSLLAGEQSLASHAFEDALSQFETGLVARDIPLSGTAAATDEEAAGLLFGLARALSATGARVQIEEAFAALSRAFDFYAAAGNVALAVAAAEFPIELPIYRVPGAAGLLTRALALVPAGSHEAGRLLSRYGGIQGSTDDYERAQEALGQALEIARREGDVRLEVRTLTYAAVVSGLHLHAQESVESGLRAIELASVDESHYSDVVSRWWTARSLLRMGDLDAARPHALVLRDLAERRGTTPQLASNGFVPVTTLSCLEGDWPAGRENSDKGLDVSPTNPQLLLLRVFLEHETGESIQGEIYLERLLEVMDQAGLDRSATFGRVGVAISAMARINGPGRLDVAEAATEAALSEQAVTPNRKFFAHVALALLAVLRGDRSLAGDQYAYLLTQRGMMIWTVSSVDRLLGLLSRTTGDLNQATVHFEEALAFCRKAGYKPELAWTGCDYADVLVEREGVVARAKAVALLTESLSISTMLGMAPLADRVTERLARIRGQAPAAQEYPGGLTPREAEVLRLVAAGRTDQEIAEELFIGVRTVNTHVSNILTKTKTSNRTEAASYANRNGLA